MQDFYAECEVAKAKRFSAIGVLAYRRQKLAIDVDRAQRETEELDGQIAGHEEAIAELEQVQRNFNSWLAVKEGALSMDQVEAGIQVASSEHPLDAEVGGGTQPVSKSMNGTEAATERETQHA